MQIFQKTIKIALTIIAILAIIAFCIKQPSVVNYVITYKIDFLILIFGLYILFYILNAYILYSVIIPYGKDVYFLKVLGINQLSSFVNYVLPFRVASIGIKVVLLKKHFNILSGITLGTFTLMSIIHSFICVFLLFISIFFLGFKAEQYQVFWGVLYGALILCAFIVFFILFNKKYKLTKAIKLPKLILDYKRSILPVDYNSLFQLMFLYLAQILIGSCITYVLFLGAGYKVGFGVCLLITVAGNLSGILALTPANIGIKEMTYIGAGAIYGVPADIIVAILLLDRFIQFLLLSIGLPFFSYLKSNVLSLK